MNDMFISKPSQVITHTIQFTEYNLYLHGEIGGPDDFMEHFAVYKTANEGDLIRLYVNSLGGSLSTGMEYIRHMRECEAKIIAVLGVEVASMASAIALEADEIELDEMSTLLIHSFQYGTQGSEFSVYNQAQFNNRLNQRWIENHFGEFLSKEELEDVFKGVDILLDAEQISRRWERLNREDSCNRDDCCEEVIHPSYDQSEEDDRVFDIYQAPITSHRTVDGKVRMTVEVEPEVFARIKDKTAELCVDIDVEDGA